MTPNTQDPTEHLSELRAIACFPTNHVRPGSRQKSSELTAAATFRDLHAQVSRDRFPAWGGANGASCSVPGDKGGQKYITTTNRDKPGDLAVSSAQPRLFLSVAYRLSEPRTPEPEHCQSPERPSHQPPVTRCLNPSWSANCIAMSRLGAW